LTLAQVNVICQAVEQVSKTILDPGEIESQLLEAAREMDPQELLRHWQQLRYQSDQEAGLEAEEEQRERRWLRLWQTWNGNYRIEGELDAECGATLRTALKGLLEPRSKDDERTAWQRWADALGELARRRLDAGDLPERGGEKPHLMLVAQLSTLRLEPGSPLAELNWGPQVTGETARRIGCDAAVTPVIVDENGEVIHVGRSSRSIRTHLRRAANIRDRHCQGPGCTVPAEECQIHHRRHWADGGRHELSNVELVCPIHHAQLHPENDRFRNRPSLHGANHDRAP
jgi:hypothetical protein